MSEIIHVVINSINGIEIFVELKIETSQWSGIFYHLEP